MSLLQRLLLGTRRNIDRLYECRRCGTSVDTTDTECPYCGLTDVVEYRLD